MRKLRHFIALVLTASLLCPVLIPIKVSAYHDTQGHWASNAIERWTKYGVVQGDGTSFRPDAWISSGEIAAILSRARILIHSAQKTMHSGTIRTSGNVYPSAFQFLKIELVFHGRMQ